MSEYISREKAVDDGYLSDWYIASVGDESPVWTDAHIDELLNDFIVIPKDTKAVDVQPVDRWISVNDRLPEEEGDVLVWIVDGKPDGIHHLESEYIANWEYGNFYDGDWNVINGITHRQPLPAPPKEGY